MDEDTIEVLETLEVVVTPDDIAKGARNDCGRCPFALALRRAGYPRSLVVYQGIEVDDKGGTRFFAHTVESKAWVQAFDGGEPVAPGLFILHRWAPAARSDLVR